MTCKECGEALDTFDFGVTHAGCCGHDESSVTVDDESRGDRGYCKDCGEVVVDFGEGWESGWI